MHEVTSYIVVRFDKAFATHCTKSKPFFHHSSSWSIKRQIQCIM